MKELQFDLSKWNSLILVNVVVSNNDNISEIVLALDTGCTQTILSPTVVSFLGLSEKDSLRKIGVTTGSRTDSAFKYQIETLNCLGFSCKNMRIIAKSLPNGLFIDGLLGLDFFKILKKKLVLDFDKYVLGVE